LYIEINPYEVDPNEPGGYTKKSLSLTEKERLYPEFIKSSPRGLVPSLTYDDKCVWESLELIEYIDETFYGPSFFPNNPYDRAMARIWSNHVCNRMQKNFYTMLMDQDSVQQEKARQDFFHECRLFARAMSSDGPYFFGNMFSIVDIALAPFWLRFIWVGEFYRGLKFPNDIEFQRLNIWWEAVQKRPSVHSTIVCKPRLVSAYSQYARNVATSDYAKTLQNSLSRMTPIQRDEKYYVSKSLRYFVFGLLCGVGIQSMISFVRKR
jgi:glutathione S-transferase